MSRKFSPSTVVEALAEKVASRLTRKVIAQLQGIKDRLSGDDSNLENAWDEICVQVQGEESYSWDAYDATVRSVVVSCLDRLPPYEVEALWLQTDEATDWLYEEEEEREPHPVAKDEVIEYIVSEYIYSAAGDWSNHRIKRYLEGEPELDLW